MFTKKKLTASTVVGFLEEEEEEGTVWVTEYKKVKIYCMCQFFSSFLKEQFTQNHNSVFTSSVHTDVKSAEVSEVWSETELQCSAKQQKKRDSRLIWSL